MGKMGYGKLEVFEKSWIEARAVILLMEGEK